MQLIGIVIVGLIVCCAQISAQNTDCDRMFRACQRCARRVPQRAINRPDKCPRLVQDRWIWREISQCELQRIYCRNPRRKITCSAIAELARMRRRPRGRCTNCTTRRRTPRTTRRTTTRSTRRTSRRLPTSRRTTRRTTPKPRTP